MYTFQDLQKNKTEQERQAFIKSAITAHKASNIYREAYVADLYDRHRNVTINQFQKILYTVTGRAVPDNWSANFKMACRHFHRFITQENQYLLGNGVTWENDATANKLGTKKLPFDNQLQKLGKKALWGGVSFGFWNLDHIDVFSILEFVPFQDEENGSLRAGIRFWQIDDKKPLRATLYEEDGFTEYCWKDEQCEILQNKRAYILNTRTSVADGLEIYDGENYPGFPIVPLWGNPEHQSELIGLREQIDCYDLIKSGFANDVDDASMIYWLIQNAGGMDDVDLAKFVERIKTVHAAVVEDDGAKAESHQQEVPYASREALLNRLDSDLYRDAMALNIDKIADGNVTATQIRAAYEALNSKTDDYEYCVLDFINGILELAGIEDNATFKRSMMVNQAEETNMVLAAAQYLDQETVLKHLPFITVDEIPEIMDRVLNEEVSRFQDLQDEEYKENEE